MVVESPKMFYTGIDFVNKSLINHTFKMSTKIQSVDDCLKLCLEESNCCSFNIKLNVQKSKGYCEINNSTVVNHPMDLITKYGYIYYQEI